MCQLRSSERNTAMAGRRTVHDLPCEVTVKEHRGQVKQKMILSGWQQSSVLPNSQSIWRDLPSVVEYVRKSGG
jgi:hypothetical protein